VNPITYDIRKAFTSKGVLAIMILIIIFSFAIIPIIKESTSSVPTPPSNVAYSVIDSSAGFQILFYAYNSFGQPLSGVQLNLTSAIPGLFSSVATTNSSGFAKMFIPYPSQQSESGYLANLEPNTNLFIGQGWVIDLPSPNTTNVSLGEPSPPVTIGTVTDSRNSSVIDSFVFAVGPNFTRPNDLLYFAITPQKPGVSSPPPLGNMTLIARITDYTNIVHLPIPSSVDPADNVWVELTSNNGSTLLSAVTPAASYTFTMQQPNAISLTSSFISGLLGSLVPLMAIIAAYSGYGRDRVSGILESVLVRPVTRRGILVSRYIAVVAAVALATLITILIADLLVWYELKQTLDVMFLLGSLGSLFVEIAAFVGIMFIISQLTKSTGALVGSGVGLFLVLDLLWSLLVALAIEGTGVGFGSLVALHIQVDLSFFNPSQFISLVQILQLKSLSGNLIQPAQFGVTPLTVGIAGLAWILIPLLISLRLVSTRD
jgi:ABC-2 type transport system permease protein